MAIAAGADVRHRADEYDPNRLSLLRGVLVDIQINLNQATSDGVDRVLELAQAAHVLIDAGDRYFDIPIDQGSLEGRRANVYMRTAIGELCAPHWSNFRKDEYQPALFGLIDKLVTNGADIDRHQNLQRVPAVVTALRMHNIDLACYLVGLGARTDDAWIRRSSTDGFEAVGSLADEACAAGGANYEAQLREALMRRHIAVGPKRSANDEVAPARRRKVAL